MSTRPDLLPTPEACRRPARDIPRVDVVILTWDDGPLLDRAVASVRGSIGVRARVIVVDNGSERPVVVAADVTLLRNAVNRGVAAGRNQGIAAGSSELVCVLDSDAVLTPDSLARLAEQLQPEDVGMAVPVFHGQRPEESAGRAPTLRTKLARLVNRTDCYRTAAAPSGSAWEVDFGIGACQLFRRRAWETVGGIDESYFYGPEDVDFCLRVQGSGWRIVQTAEARVHHPPRRRFRRLATRRGLSHAWCVVRYLVRHRRHLRGRTAVGRAASPLAR